MGSASGQICRSCGTRFTVQSGGGFYFDLLHCDTCGRTQNAGHRDLGDIHLRFVKGLSVPYTVSRRDMDRRIQLEYPGEPLTKAEYHAAVEATFEPCACDGNFRYDAPPRCPSCRSTGEHWDADPEAGRVFYD